VAGIVDDDIEAAHVIQDVRDAGLGRAVGLDIQFDGAQVQAVLNGPGRDFGDAGRIAALGLAHRGIDGVTGLGEGACGHEAEARGGASDENDLLEHGEGSFESDSDRGCERFRGRLSDQMIPPLARRVWPLIQAPSGPARKATASAMSSG
jgi:hypothetical protein